MTPEEKAKDLIKKMMPFPDTDTNEYRFYHRSAKQCALIAVQTVQDALNVAIGAQVHLYWEQVKKSLTNL